MIAHGALRLPRSASGALLALHLVDGADEGFAVPAVQLVELAADGPDLGVVRTDHAEATVKRTWPYDTMGD